MGDVRGKGLMIGIEMVEDKETKTPLNQTAMMQIWDRTKEAGVLIGKHNWNYMYAQVILKNRIITCDWRNWFGIELFRK